MSTEAVPIVAEVAKQSLLGSFGVTWKLFLAQLLNFSIVLFVLWKWVFTPAMASLEKRRKTIEQGLDDAEKAGTARLSAEQEKEALIVSARQEARRIMEEAHVETDRVRKETVEKTKSEVAETIAQGKRKLDEEKEAIVRQAKTELAEIVVASTEKVLAETGSDAKQKDLIHATVQKLIG